MTCSYCKTSIPHRVVTCTRCESAALTIREPGLFESTLASAVAEQTRCIKILRQRLADAEGRTIEHDQPYQEYVWAREREFRLQYDEKRRRAYRAAATE
jgi:hypothetical protein